MNEVRTPPLRRGSRRRALGWVAATLLIWALAWTRPLCLGGARPIDPPGEFELKAVFVLNFIRLVNWGGVPGEENGSELPVCAVANSDFARAIRQVVAGKMVGTRSISFKITPSPDPAHCRALVVDSAHYAAAGQALDAVRDAPVLTIGNGSGFLTMGGMFQFVVEDRRVQFDASLDAIRRAKLDVSARLLQLSRNLRKGGAGVY